MTVWDFFSRLLSGAFPIGNFLFIIAGFSLFIVIFRKALFKSFLNFLKQEADFPTRTELSENHFRHLNRFNKVLADSLLEKDIITKDAHNHLLDCIEATVKNEP
jgi:hypothetical protein